MQCMAGPPPDTIRCLKLTLLALPSLDPSKWTDLKLTSFQPKTFKEDDVEVAITHCGVCGSDVHTLSQGWGESKLPLVAGHEIVGHVTRVGDKVTEFKVGQRVGVGAQIASCMQCRACKEGYENYCPDELDTYVCVPSYALCMAFSTNKHCNDRTASTTTVSPLRVDTLPPFVRISALSSRSRTRSSPRTPRRCSAPASQCTPLSRRTAVVRVRRSVLSASAG